MSVRQEINEIRDALKRANIKVTLPRIMIYQILKGSAQGITAYDIEHASIQFNNRINLATIYSNLKLFQNMGLIQRYKMDVEQALYKLAQPESAGSVRILCNNCGSIEVFNEEQINQQVSSICANKKLQLQSYHLLMNIDLCDHCKKKLN